MSRKIVHYLRNERRRLGLTQADVTALLGVRWKTRVSRYERQRTLPPLDVGLAYETIAGKPVAEIFGGAQETIEEGVRERARDLLAKSEATNTPGRERRRQSLERIAA